MPVKIAISGKGGVGKTTLTAFLAVQYSKEGKKVLAVDADPASSLPVALGVPMEKRDAIRPLSQMLDSHRRTDRLKTWRELWRNVLDKSKGR